MTGERRFQFRLALALGYANPDQMLRDMPHTVYLEWMDYAQEEPFGQIPSRLGYLGAALGSLLAKPRGKRAWAIEDFMPDAPQSRQRVKTPDEQLAVIQMVTLMSGGKIIDKRKRRDASQQGN